MHGRFVVRATLVRGLARRFQHLAPEFQLHGLGFEINLHVLQLAAKLHQLVLKSALRAAEARTRDALEAVLAPALDSAVNTYIELRSQWSSHVHNLAPAMRYSEQEIDPSLL